MRIFEPVRQWWAMAREIAESTPPGDFRAIAREIARRSGSASDPRSLVFPEYGLRDTSELLSASFDPFNLSVRSERSRDVTVECELIATGRLEELKKLAGSKLASLNSKQRIDYVFQITSELHELRHYHDHFGTTFGFSRIVETINDQIAFNQLWDALKHEGRIKLPLLKWATAPDAPEALRSYLVKRRAYVEWMNLYDGSLGTRANIDLNQGQASEAETIIVVSVGGVGTYIPAATLNYQDELTGRVFQGVIPLGGTLLMEGTAFVMQRILARRIFGGEYSDQLKNHPVVRRGPLGETRWPLYMAADLYLSKYLPRFYEHFQLALSDLSMMALGADGNAFEDLHPGWRFSNAVKAAARNPEIHQRRGVDLRKYMDGVARRRKWSTVADVARRAVTRSQALLDDLKRSKEAETFWPAVLRAALNLHLKWMEVRTDLPTVLADPDVYLRMLPHFPEPPIREGGEGLVFRGVTQDDAHAFRQWFMFEHFQRQLLFSLSLPCPATLVHPHQCPGDPLRKRRWAPTDQCSFSHVMKLLGVREVKAEPA